MYYHLIIEITENKEKKEIYLTDQENYDEILEYAKSYINNCTFFVDGYPLSYGKISRFKIVSTDRKAKDIAAEINKKCAEKSILLWVSSNDVLGMEEYTKDLTSKILNDLNSNDNSIKEENNMKEFF